jgi:uncharacterized protein with GYD domain
VPTYLSYAKYTADALTHVRKEGYATREAQMRSAVESVGGTLKAVYFILPGEWDFVSVVEFETSAGAFAIRSLASASGIFERVDYVEVLSGAEADMVVSGQVSWRPPGEA